MKKIGYLLLLGATATWAQSAPNTSAAGPATPEGTVSTTANFPLQRVQMPTYADVYCAGFINRQTLPDAHFVGGGLETPSTTKFVRGDIVYLYGSGYTPGAEYEIIRALRDINEYEMFPGQRKLLKSTGQPYMEVGRVRIVDTRSKTAVAHVEYSCDPINLGDTAIPFAEKTMVAFHPPLRFDVFLPTGSKVSGRIVMAKDFDAELGTGQKVYINVGSNQGVKVGDYFRIFRFTGTQHETDYQTPRYAFDMEQGDAVKDVGVLGFGAVPKKWDWNNTPREDLGEGIVLRTGPNSSTVLITFTLREIFPGDYVEVE